MRRIGPVSSKPTANDFGESKEQVMDNNDIPSEDLETTEPKAGDRFRAQSGTVREEVRELGRVTRDAAQEKLDGARQTAEEVYQQGRQKAEELLDQGKRKAGDVEDQVVDYIREKPLKALAIAAGVGLVLGVFFSKR
jgi:ElaB/YqjD/DUF883 family membrane-anchored ribosome-binding protein